MNLHKIGITLLSIIYSTSVFSQKLVNVLDETVIANSKTCLWGNKRNMVSARLPIGTQSYVYRITVAKKDGLIIGNSLFELLKKSDVAAISYGSAVAQFAINNGANEALDAYIFTNNSDAEYFHQDKGTWDYCRRMTSIKNTCRIVTDCIGQNIYFGFENQNIMQGLDVKLEVVAIVNNNPNGKCNYTYQMQNTTDKIVNYYSSIDGKNWNQRYIAKAHSTSVPTIESSKGYIWFAVESSIKGQVQRIQAFPSMRYKIFWDDGINSYNIKSW